MPDYLQFGMRETLTYRTAKANLPTSITLFDMFRRPFRTTDRADLQSAYTPHFFIEF
jgi:hypothetical protein